MELDVFGRLLAAGGRAALIQAESLGPSEATFLRDFTRLSRHVDHDLARAALETVLLRRRAGVKFSRADAMYFTREALEQSSGEAVAAHRARRYRGFATVADLACGAGGDAAALAAASHVIGVDIDPLRLAMAERNLAAYGRTAEFHRLNLDLDDPPPAEAIFFDPARRDGDRRGVSLAAYRPSIDRLRGWLESTPAAGVKVAPGVGWHELREWPAEAEFVSLAGELKECVLWFGPFRTCGRRATVLPAGASLAADEPADPPPVGGPLAYLYEPDPAVIRAGLVADLAHQLDARQMDAEIAYLTSDSIQETDFAAAHDIDEWMPFHVKKLRQRLTELNVGRVTVLKRGSAVKPDDLTRQLKLKGDEHREVILTRHAGKPVALIARRRQ